MAPEDSAWQAMPYFSEIGCSCNFWLKQGFYVLLVESILIRAKVNFCNELLRNQAELKFLHQIRLQFNLQTSK